MKKLDFRDTSTFIIVCNPEDVKKCGSFLHCQAWTGLRNRIQGFGISRSSDPWIFQDGWKSCKIGRSTNWKQKGLFCHNLSISREDHEASKCTRKTRYKCMRNWCYVLIENPNGLYVTRRVNLYENYTTLVRDRCYVWAPNHTRPAHFSWFGGERKW